MQKVDKAMIIMEIMQIHEGLESILAASGMHCLGCAASPMESLEDACMVHGIDADSLVDRMNEYLLLVG